MVGEEEENVGGVGAGATGAGGGSYTNRTKALARSSPRIRDACLIYSTETDGYLLPVLTATCSNFSSFSK